MFVISLCLVLSVVARVSCAGNVDQSPRVLLVYPDGGALYKVVMGISVPVDVKKKFLSWAVNFQFQYKMPENITEIAQYVPIILRRDARRNGVQRRDVYKSIEQQLNSLNMNGKECVLHMICEVSKLPTFHNGFIGELLQIIFTPNYGSSHTREDIDNIYTEASEVGTTGNMDCSDKYPRCSRNVFDIISYIL